MRARSRRFEGFTTGEARDAQPIEVSDLHRLPVSRAEARGSPRVWARGAGHCRFGRRLWRCVRRDCHDLWRAHLRPAEARAHARSRRQYCKGVGRWEATALEQFAGVINQALNIAIGGGDRLFQEEHVQSGLLMTSRTHPKLIHRERPWPHSAWSPRSELA